MSASIIPIKATKEYRKIAAAGQRKSTNGLILQAYQDTRIKISSVESALRAGITASKKVGGAVERNRAKRRLRSLIRTVLAKHAKPGVSYVLIAKAETVKRDFTSLTKDLHYALHALELFRPN